MARNRDDETGKYEQVYTDEKIRSVLAGTRLATGEVADRLGCHRTTAHERLKELEQEGLVVSSEAGRTYIWEWNESDQADSS